MDWANQKMRRTESEKRTRVERGDPTRIGGARMENYLKEGKETGVKAESPSGPRLGHLQFPQAAPDPKGKNI